MPTPLIPTPVVPSSSATKTYNLFIDYSFIPKTRVTATLRILYGKMSNVKYAKEFFSCDVSLTNAELGELIDEMSSSSVAIDDFYIEISGNTINYGTH
jgi:hypothetical protein